MAFRSVGINLFGSYLAEERTLAVDLHRLKEANPDFVEVCPHALGVILGGRLDRERVRVVEEILGEAGHAYTVHAPHSLNLMDLDLHRAVLEASVAFAGGIEARVVVCHAGKREQRHARHRLGDQLAAEREALREAGDLAASLGVTLAVENSYPEPPIYRGETYAYAAWPSELGGQVAATDHPAVGVCLDVGHAAVAASAFGFDYLEECAAVAPLVRHLHLHDNLGRPEPEGGEPRISERMVYGMGDLHLPPGRGTIPLERLFRRVEFAHDPTVCVELLPDFRSLAKSAVEDARKLGESVGVSTVGP
jgi:sugar phosphate isomerase/epimerase